MQTSPPVSTRLLATLFALIVVVLSSASAASVYEAGDPGRRIAARSTPDDFDAAKFRNHAAIHALIDTLVEPLGSPVTLDHESFLQIVSRTRSRSGSSFWQVDNGALSGDSLDMALYRRFAHAAPLPPLWGYRAGLSSTRSFDEFPLRSSQKVKQAMLANAVAADSLLRSGNDAAAIMRARENIAVSRQYLDQPIGVDLLMGRYLARTGALLLARVALEAGEPATATAAKRLATLVSNTDRIAPGPQWFYTTGRDPSSTALLQIAQDRTLPPAMRYYALVAVTKGACFNTREMLLGTSNERRDLLHRIDGALSDLPRNGEFVSIGRNELHQFDVGIDVPPSERPRLIKRSNGLLHHLLPEGVSRRVAYCRQQM